MTALKLHDICFSYNSENKVLDHVCMELKEGSASAIHGPSGAGKSTLGMIACGLIPKIVPGFFTGSVEVFSTDIADKKIHQTASLISMVLQDGVNQLFSTSVIDEAAFAPENLCINPKEINRRAETVLDSTGLAAYLQTHPAMLSGGQQKLLALASILTLAPKILILDEPAAGVDEQRVAFLKEIFLKLKNKGKTLLIIEHSQVFSDLCDTVYELKNGNLNIADNA
ncbi:MAG: ABC transporter ATP-binding protein [Spirochaetia bacterium]|jgi:energy-coupling factor transporter ATP-binding protein EcfA2|nr:ABC transporter ATP-binding protein [Spirochaetia bacterium]